MGNLSIYVALILAVLGSAVGAAGTIISNRANDIITRKSNERIAEAGEVAANSTRIAAEANLKAHRANAEIALANQEISIQKTLAAELESQTAKAKLETEKLRQQISWRRLEGTQKTNLIALARKTPQSINIYYSIGDSEARTFASDIGSALREAGWNVGHSARNPSTPVFGVILIVPPSDPTAVLVGAILGAGSIACSFGSVSVGSSMDTMQVRGPILFVGSKPQN